MQTNRKFKSIKRADIIESYNWLLQRDIVKKSWKNYKNQNFTDQIPAGNIE